MAGKPMHQKPYFIAISEISCKFFGLGCWGPVVGISPSPWIVLVLSLVVQASCRQDGAASLLWGFPNSPKDLEGTRGQIQQGGNLMLLWKDTQVEGLLYKALGKCLIRPSKRGAPWMAF